MQQIMHGDVKMAVITKLTYSCFFLIIQEFRGVCRETKEQRCDCMDQSLYKAIQ